MISFREYFLLFENRQYMYGWMAPNGNLYPNQGDDVHHDTASQLIVRFNIPRTSSNLYEVMFEAGWMRLESSIEGTLFCNNSKYFPNDAQKRALKRLAEQNRMKEILFDSDRTSKVIWTSEDF